MRISLLTICLLAALRLAGQPVAYQHPETGLWGLADENQRLDAVYDSITTFGWNYESTFFLWKGGQARIISQEGNEGRMLWLDRSPMDRVLYDADGTMCVVRVAADSTWRCLATEADRRDGELAFFRLPPITDCRFVGECLWLRSAEGEALLHAENYHDTGIKWYAQVQARHCEDALPFFIFQDHRGRYALGDQYTDDDFDVVAVQPLGAPCERLPIWLTLHNGTHAITDEDGYRYPVHIKDVKVDTALAREVAFRDGLNVPFYRVDAQGRRWYGCLSGYELLVPPIFPLAYLRAAVAEPVGLPADRRVLRGFQPANAHVVEVAGKAQACLLTDARRKATWLASIPEGDIYPAAFVVDALADAPSPTFNEWGHVIAGNGQGAALRYGVLDREGHAILPPVYTRITLTQAPDGTWAYAATRDGITRLYSEEGQALE